MLDEAPAILKWRERSVRLTGCSGVVPLLLGVLLGLFCATVWTRPAAVGGQIGPNAHWLSSDSSSSSSSGMQCSGSGSIAQAIQAEAHLPPLVRRGWLPGHVEYDLSRTRVDVHRALALRYLEPFISPSGSGRVLTSRMLDVAELLYNRTAFRVRIVDGRLYFRHMLWFHIGYYYDRMSWILRTLQEMIDEGLLPVQIDAVISVSTGPSVAVDTSLGDDAGFPLFSLRTSTLHSDVPLPHPMTYGAHGDYTWSAEARSIPWPQRTARAGFFGKATCFPMHADNWHMCPRVRATQLARRYPELMDVGLTKWHLAERRAVLYNMSRIPEIELSTGLNLTATRSWEEQAAYRYVLDIDGDLGSSRKPGILGSGSLLISQRSASYNYFEPLLTPGRHFLLYEQWFDTLPTAVRWAQDHDERARDIQLAGLHFTEHFLSIDGAKEYMSVLFTEYSRLLADAVDLRSVPRRECTLLALDSLAGCDWGWLLYNGTSVKKPPSKERRKLLEQRRQQWAEHYGTFSEL